jgi:hypothetical protein
MSDSDTSIEARSIISSLAATSSFSAVVFLPTGSLLGTLVFKADPIPARRKSGPHISACRACTQELID